MVEQITKQYLLDKAKEICDEKNEAQNTATRIGYMFLNIIDNLAVALDTADSNKAGLMSVDMVKSLQNLSTSVTTLSNELGKKLNKSDKYVHPQSHSATMITPTSDRQFVSSQEKSSWNTAVNKIFWESLPDLIAKLHIPSKVSELTNDSHFLTQHQDISHLAVKTEVTRDFATKKEVEGKLDSNSAAQTYATKTELGKKANSADVANEFATKKELAGKANNNDVANTYATKEALKIANATIEQQKKEIDNLKSEQSVSISEFVSGVIVAPGSTSENGSLVYDQKANKFLWKVMYNGVPNPTYFSQTDKNILVGKTPKMGVVYLCGNRVYVGVSGGLCELLRNEII